MFLHDLAVEVVLSCLFPSAAALHTLRGAIRSTMASKPDFRLRHTSLTTAECDMKKTLGQACENELILARVEPVRGTKVRAGEMLFLFGWSTGLLLWSELCSGVCRYPEPP